MTSRAVWIKYCNWKGVIAWRHILPESLSFGECEWHPGPQWLLLAFDHGKNDVRTFALKDVLAWSETDPGETVS